MAARWNSSRAPDKPRSRSRSNALAADGKITMPIGKTFFAQRFGAVADKFGVQWMVIVQPIEVDFDHDESVAYPSAPTTKLFHQRLSLARRCAPRSCRRAITGQHRNPAQRTSLNLSTIDSALKRDGET
jgi:hypothetical protein